MTPGEPEADVVEVKLLGLPVILQLRASEHNDGLRREFQMLVEQGHVEPSSVPARLTALAADLDRRFLAFTAASRAELEEAAKRGVSSIDLVLSLPREVGPAARDFKRLAEEADDYCRSGEHLLTLAPAREVVAFRTWALEELIGQAEGREPISWPDYAAKAGV